MSEEQTKKRAPNFSSSDCLLLAEVMGKDCSLDSRLSNYAYIKHKFTNTITTSTKKKVWESVTDLFCQSSEFKRDRHELYKKWDNLVQKHRAIYADFQHSLFATGGGPVSSTLSVLTEGVMAVVGRNVVNVTGIDLPSVSDSAWIQIEQNSTDIQDTSCINAETSIIETVTTTSNQRKRCNCDCHNEVTSLKVKKMKLQIKLLERQLKHFEE